MTRNSDRQPYVVPQQVKADLRDVLKEQTDAFLPMFERIVGEYVGLAGRIEAARKPAETRETLARIGALLEEVRDLLTAEDLNGTSTAFTIHALFAENDDGSRYGHSTMMPKAVDDMLSEIRKAKTCLARIRPAGGARSKPERNVLAVALRDALTLVGMKLTAKSAGRFQAVLQIALQEAGDPYHSATTVDRLARRVLPRNPTK